jgi:hypothetical protein
MRVAAETPGCASAIAASLGPMEAALENLERTVEAMEVVARERLSEATVCLGGRWTHVGVARTVHEIEQLSRALSNARLACQTARECAGPIIAEVTAI